MKYNLVGYGSLIHPDDWPSTCNRCYLVKIKGYERNCDHKTVNQKDVENNKGVFNIKNEKNSWINGILLEGISEEDWRDILYRERGYSMLELNKNKIETYESNYNLPDDEVKIFQGVRHMEKPSSNWGYVQRCLNGAKKFGDEFLRDFLNTTYVYKDGDKIALNKIDKEELELEF